MEGNPPISKGKVMINLEESPLLSFDFRVRNPETLQLENTILKQIIIELESDWRAPRFDHIWAEQIELHLEDKEDL